MKHWNLILLILLTFPMACKSQPSKTEETPKRLIPYLFANGKMGYTDTLGQTAISPRYQFVYPFKNGFAVVEKEGKFGVIDAHGKSRVPCKYSVTQIFSHPPYTLLISKKEYNAWWQFWHWRIAPEWNILGGNSGPFLVTKVPRAHWQIKSLPALKTLYSSHRMDDLSVMGTSQYWKKDWQPDRFIPEDFRITSGNRLLMVNGKRYQLKSNGRLKALSGKFITAGDHGEMMVRRNGRIILIDEEQKQKTDENFAEVDELYTQSASGKKIGISKYDDMGRAYPRIPTPIFKSDKGAFFITPDFSNPFPAIVQKYQGAKDSLSAEDILSGAVSISALPNGDFFVASGAGHNEGSGWNAFVLQPDGSWNMKIPLMRGVQDQLTDGRMTFEGNDYKGVLDTDNLFYPMPLIYIRACARHHFWYMGKDTTSEKYGVYDAKNKRWQVTPKYDYLQDEIAPDIAIYSKMKKDPLGNTREFFGLLNLKGNREITPPLYLSLDETGGATRLIDGQKKSFYINVQTGEEYRQTEENEK